MDPQSPTNPNPSADDPQTSMPQPGQSIEPTISGADEPMGMPVSDPSPLDAESPSLDDSTLSTPQPEAFQADAAQLDEETPVVAGAPASAPPETAAQDVRVSVEQAQPQSSNIPAFMQHPKPAEPTQPITSPTSQPPAQTPPTPGAAAPVAVVKPARKSKKLLFIIIALVVLLAGGGTAAYMLTRDSGDATNDSAMTTDESEEPQDTPGDEAEESESPAEATTAEYLSDFDAVCEGGAISNAGSYSSNKTAVIYTFRNNPINNFWNSQLIGYGKSYYPESLDELDKVTVVACVEYIKDSQGTPLDCTFESQGQTVTIKYHSLKYSLTYYEAKTGKKISDGGEIDGPAPSCPGSVLYDQATKTAYARPDDKALEAAFDKFIQ